jgi:hypothetical protein
MWPLLFQILTAVTAAAAFALSLRTRLSDRRQLRVRDWQRVVVYTIIETMSLQKRAPTLVEVQTQYLQKAQQLTQFKLRREQLQEGVLRYILMGLQHDGLIELGEGAKYRLSSKAALDAYTATQLAALLRERRLRPRVLEVIAAGRGSVTRDGLAKALRDHLDGCADYDELDNLVWELTGRPRVAIDSEGRLNFDWSRKIVQQREDASASSPETPEPPLPPQAA